MCVLYCLLQLALLMLSRLALLLFLRMWASFMPLPVGFAYVSMGFAYSDLNKSFIPPMLPSRFVASYGR